MKLLLVGEGGAGDDVRFGPRGDVVGAGDDVRGVVDGAEAGPGAGTAAGGEV